VNLIGVGVSWRWPFSSYPPSICLEGLRKTKTCQDGVLVGNFHWAPPEYKAEASLREQLAQCRMRGGWLLMVNWVQRGIYQVWSNLRCCLSICLEGLSKCTKSPIAGLEAKIWIPGLPVYEVELLTSTLQCLVKCHVKMVTGRRWPWSMQNTVPAFTCWNFGKTTKSPTMYWITQRLNFSCVFVCIIVTLAPSPENIFLALGGEGGVRLRHDFSHLLCIWCSFCEATCTGRLCLEPNDPVLCSVSSPPFQPRLFTSLFQVCSTSVRFKGPHLQITGAEREKEWSGSLNSRKKLCLGSGFRTPP
jgi:hypothetical protein